MAEPLDDEAGFKRFMAQVLQMPVEDLLAMVADTKAQFEGVHLALLAAALMNKAKLCANVASLCLRSDDPEGAAEASEATQVLIKEAEALLVTAGDFEGRTGLVREVEQAKVEIAGLLRGEVSQAEREGVAMAKRALAQRGLARPAENAGCGGVLLFGVLVVAAVARVAIGVVGS